MKNKRLRVLTDKVIAALASRWCFGVVLGLFVAQAAWLAASAAYPMLYDEYYHPGVIEVYSHQLSPFITHQTPEQTALYMDLTRMPSYLYHYLLSFPYRLVSFFSDSFYLGIVSLRLLNVAMVAGGLVVFRRLLLKIGFSKAMTHASLLFLTLLPLFVHVAAHVNYDNLLFLLTPLFLLYGVKVLQAKKFNLTDFCWFMALGLLGCLVKVNFLALLLAGGGYVATVLLIRHRRRLPAQIIRSFLEKSWVVRLGLCVLLVVSLGLFAERFAINQLKFSNIQPSCQAVQPLNDCLKQPIVSRGVAAKKALKARRITVESLPEYTLKQWTPAMITGSLFVYANVGAQDNFQMTTRGNERGAPLPILRAFLWSALVVAIVAGVVALPRLMRMPHFWFFAAVVGFYLLSILVYVNYFSYRRNGQPFGMQPRYFIVIMPLVFAYATQALGNLLKWPLLKLASLAAVLIIFTQGAGAATYIVRSNQGWYWQRGPIISINMQLKQILAPVIKEN